MTEQPLISVIVPVYNVEAYLDTCLESIVSQTYRNLEIIVVDDGSTDSCGTICDRWAGQDERIRVIHQPNGGLSAARNSGLDVMKGELVMMVDSDDVMRADAINALLETRRQHPDADIVMGSYVTFDSESLSWPVEDFHDCKTQTLNQHEAILSIFYQRDIDHSAWGRLYPSSMFDDIRYPQGLYYEDLAIIYSLLKKCSSVVKLDYTLYGYRQRKNSILEKFSPKRSDVLDICEGLEMQMQQEDPQYLKAVRSRLLSTYFNILLLSHQDRSGDHKALEKRCWEGIKRLRHNCLMDSNVRAKNKLGIVASFAGKRFLCDLLGRNYHPTA